MKLKWISFLSLIAAALLFIPALLRADVRDNAHIFSQQAVDDANRAMRKMKQTHNKEFVVETFSAIPDDQKDAYAQNKETFFKDWMAARAKALKVNGVYALICMDPRHLEVGAGKNTVARGDFTQDDLDNLATQMRESLKNNQFDKALSDAIDTVDRAYTTNISEPGGRSSFTPRETEFLPGRYRQSYPASPMPFPSQGTVPSLQSFSVGSIICMVVAVVLIFSLIRSILRGGMGGYQQGGGYGGNYGGGYGGGGYGGGGYFGGGYGGGGYGGGGGGFGRGFLGGLLGGALGGYAADRWDRRNDQQGGFPQGNPNDNFGAPGDPGGGGSFDPGPSDAGQGFGDNSAGGDFGSSGGGGGGDSGGGSSGGDF